MLSRKRCHEIDSLILKVLENCISDEELQQLDELFSVDADLIDYYCEFVKNYTALRMKFNDEMGMINELVQVDGVDAQLWQELAEYEMTSPAIVMPDPDQLPERDVIRKVHQKERTIRPVNKTPLSLAIISTAAFLVMIAYLHFAPSPPYEVATISDSIDAEWSSGLPLKAGTHIATYAKPIQLTHGIVKLIAGQNVHIVLEAPTEFRFVSDSEIALSYGKLFAHVSDQDRGFSVTMPNSKVVDMGTEFGVISQIDGNTDVYMYKGKATLFSVQKKSENQISKLLTAGSAQKVDRTNSAITEISMQEDIVVRDINSKTRYIWRGQPLNLADVVGGGNGLGSGALDAGIDPTTGMMRYGLDESIRAARLAPHRFLVAPDNLFVDSIFIPGLDKHPTQVASTGLTCEQFPATSGSIWGYPFNGAWHEGVKTPRHTLVLDGQRLEGASVSAVTIHPNMGITFDLKQIHQAVPGLLPVRFLARAGLSETIAQATNKRPKVEFWVLVDGRVLMRQPCQMSDGGFDMNVSLEPGVRFLSLAVTELEGGHGNNWSVFVNPRLELSTK